MRELFQRVPLSEVAHVERGKFSARPRNDPQYYGGDIPFIQTGDVARAGREIREWTQTLNEKGLRVSNLFPAGTIFMAIAANVGDVATTSFDAACPDSVVGIRPRTDVDREWLFQMLAFSKDDLAALSTQNAQANLSLEKILPFRVPHPTFAEQRKIAAILRTWDLGLEKLSTLRTAKERRFVGLRQHLFGDRGGYTGHWQSKPLSAITTRVRRRNDGGGHPVMTISAKSGFLMQSDKFARDMAGSSAERYTLLHQGEFAYNKGNSLTAPYGCIYELDRPTAVVPFVYYSFALIAGLDRIFYKHLFSGGVLNHQLSRVINSGVRNDGLLNLDVEDFFGCKVPVPPIEEQREIGRILTTAKSELDLLDREIAALTRQKRGLMQKLLTGEWSVNLEGAAA